MVPSAWVRALGVPLIVLAWLAVLVVGGWLLGHVARTLLLVVLVAGTELFGIWGALFAAPLAGLLQAIATAAWLEFRGGKPHEILQAMTEAASQQAEQRVGLA
jgi:hypothetical protein